MKVYKIKGNEEYNTKAEQKKDIWYAFRIKKDAIFFRYEKKKLKIISFLEKEILVKKI
jgi:hypothetical protein